MDAMARLSELGRQIAREQDALLLDTNAMQRVRDALVGVPKSRRMPLGAVIGGIAAAAAVLALVVGMRLSDGGKLGLVVAGSAVAEPEGTWVSAGHSAVPVQFSDGSRIVLEPESRARVVDVTEHGAEMVVEGGAAHFDIVPRKSANWHFSFGPFGVEVIGTQFDVSWNPDKDLFELTLRRGKVKVTGCVFGDGRPVLAGETVRASCANHQFEITTAHQHAAASPTPSPPSSVREPEPAPMAPSAASSTAKARAATAPTREEASWQALARQNRYAEAFAAADSAGFAAECARASARDLSLLGASARLSGHPTEAVLAFETLRSRFAGSRAAALAAYDLARIAFDQRHAYNDAARWFSVYLREQPRGELAREALGRLMESQSRAGDHGRAGATAARDLEADPSGPHAALAKSLVSH